MATPNYGYEKRQKEIAKKKKKEEKLKTRADLKSQQSNGEDDNQNPEAIADEEDSSNS